MRLSMEEVRKQHDGIKKLYEQGLRGATASVEQILDLFDTIEALQQENEKLKATLAADKDEQTKRLEEGLKKLRSSFQWLSESIRDLGYRAWAENNIGKIDALLGGAEDVIDQKEPSVW